MNTYMAYSDGGMEVVFRSEDDESAALDFKGTFPNRTEVFIIFRVSPSNPFNSSRDLVCEVPV